MSLMKFREANKARRIGVKPGHDGTQILEHATAVNTTTVIYTVTAAKTLYLTFASLGIYGNASGGGRIVIRDTGDVVVVNLFRVYTHVNTGGVNPCASFYPPIEIPAGYDIALVSGAAGLNIFGCIHGWEE